MGRALSLCAHILIRRTFRGRKPPEPLPCQAGGESELFHAVSTVTYTDTHGSTPVANHYTYDQNGNMTGRVVNGVTWTLTYNQDNRLQAMSNASLSTVVTFTYEADGNKVAQINNGTVTYYFPSTGSGRRLGGAYEVTGT